MTPSHHSESHLAVISCSCPSKPTKLTTKKKGLEERELLAQTDSLASEQNTDSQSREP